MTFLCVCKSNVLCGERHPHMLARPPPRRLHRVLPGEALVHAPAPNAGDWAVKSAAQYYLLPPVWRGPQLNGRLHFASRIVPEHTHGTLGFDQCTPLTPTVGAFSLVSGGISIHSGWGLYSVEVPRGRGFLTELITPVWAETGKYGYGSVPVTWDCAFG